MIPDNYQFKSSLKVLTEFFERSTVWQDILASLRDSIDKGHDELSETMVEGPELYKLRGKLGILKYLANEFAVDLLEEKQDQIEEQNEEKENTDATRVSDSYIEGGEWPEG